VADDYNDLIAMLKSRCLDGIEMKRRGQKTSRFTSTLNTLNNFFIFCAREESSVMIQQFSNNFKNILKC
jgi:hypothetical protein